MKMTMMMPGWSAHGGQTLSPYVGKIEENEKILGHSVRRKNTDDIHLY
jgi:amidase